MLFATKGCVRLTTSSTIRHLCLAGIFRKVNTCVYGTIVVSIVADAALEPSTLLVDEDGVDLPKAGSGSSSKLARITLLHRSLYTLVQVKH